MRKVFRKREILGKILRKNQERNFGKVLKENQSQTEGRIGGSEGDADDE